MVDIEYNECNEIFFGIDSFNYFLEEENLWNVESRSWSIF